MPGKLENPRANQVCDPMQKLGVGAARRQIADPDYDHRGTTFRELGVSPELCTVKSHHSCAC